MWGSHRDVTEMRFDEKLGKERPYQITGSTKMRRYQSGYREHLISKGFEIEVDVNPEGTSLEKDALTELTERKHEVDRQESIVKGRELALDDREKLLDLRDRRLNDVEDEQRVEKKRLDADLAEIPAMKLRAVEEAKKITVDATQEADKIVGDAEAKAFDIRAQATRERAALLRGVEKEKAGLLAAEKTRLVQWASARQAEYAEQLESGIRNAVDAVTPTFTLDDIAGGASRQLVAWLKSTRMPDGRPASEHATDAIHAAYVKRHTELGVVRRGAPEFEVFANETVDQARASMQRRLRGVQHQPGRGRDDLQR